MSRPAAKRPNLLLIMADQLAPQMLRAYGRSRTLTPHIDRLAEQGRRVRERLLQLPALRAVAVLDVERAAAVPHRRVRQRGRAPRLGAHLQPLSARRGLPHLSRRQDALRRARPAARLRGARHHRHLPVDLPVVAGLAPGRRELARVVPQHAGGARFRAAPAQRQRRLRRRGRVRGRPLAARAGRRRGRPAVRAYRVVHLPARPLSRASPVVGAVPRGRDGAPGGGGHSAGESGPAQPAALVPHRAAPRRDRRSRRAAHAPRLLRGHRLCRCQGWQAAGNPRRNRRGPGHDDRLHVRSRRPARRARHVLQDVVLRMVGSGFP